MAIFEPRFDQRVVVAKLGEMFGIDPALIVDSQGESSSDDPNMATVTIEARMRIPIGDYMKILNTASIR